MVPEISKVRRNRSFEMPSDISSVKFGICSYLEINVKENEHHLEMTKYARKKRANPSLPYARASL